MSKQISGGVIDPTAAVSGAIFSSSSVCRLRCSVNASMLAADGTGALFTAAVGVADGADGTVLATDANCALFAPTNVARGVAVYFASGGAEGGKHVYATVLGLDQFGTPVSDVITVAYNDGSDYGQGNVAFSKITNVAFTTDGLAAEGTASVGYGDAIGLLRSVTDLYDVISYVHGATVEDSPNSHASTLDATYHTITGATAISTDGTTAQTASIITYLKDLNHTVISTYGT